jgi:predicted membrane-bound spermidine synthase
MKELIVTMKFVSILVMLGIIGEIRCIYQFFTSDFEASYKREIIYGVSACTGIGAVVGYFNIADTPPVSK